MRPFGVEFLEPLPQAEAFGESGTAAKDELVPTSRYIEWTLYIIAVPDAIKDDYYGSSNLA